MTGDTIRHFERAHLHDLLHVGNVAMTRGASDVCLQVRSVREAGVIRETVDALPHDRLLLDPRETDLLDFGLPLPDCDVAGHALLHLWQTGRNASARRAVTEGAVESSDLRVYSMVECDGLGGRRWWPRGKEAWRRDSNQEYSSGEHYRW